MHNKTNIVELPLHVRLFPWSGHHPTERFQQILCNHIIKFSLTLYRSNELSPGLYMQGIILYIEAEFML